MDLTNCDSFGETPIRPCNCYKEPGLKEAILDSTQEGNFKNRYALGDQLGWGRFGIIRECLDKLTGEVLACKSIAKERLVTPDDVRSVKLEIEIMTKLSGHENVVDLKAVYEEDDYVHLLMELCAGGELFHRIEKQGRLSEHEARVIFRQLMEVVLYCHDKGIVHRDLKPENILVVSKSASSPIKLADFGLATHVKPGEMLHGTVGSPFYIAPEVLSGGYNQAADVWSAGVILYILLSGMPPFWGKTKSKIFDAVRAADLHFHSDPWDHISASAKALVSEMLCIDPSKRLAAGQVLAHSWMKDSTLDTQEPYAPENFGYGKLEVGGYSFSIPYMSRDQDYSFADGSPPAVSSKEESPVFTCRSSFSSLPINHGTPCSVSGGFSFGSHCESDAPEFASPIPSLPSFTFFSQSSVFESSNMSLNSKANLSAGDRDISIEKLLLSPDPAKPSEQKVDGTDRKSDFRLGVAATSVSKVSSVQRKRNHTIGLGELDQLNLIVTESVIRWASCTQIPSALRSSLVC